MVTNSPAGAVRLRYDATAMTLHWLIALGVIANLAIGLYMGDVPRSDPMKFALITTHKSIGLTVLTLSVLRVVWRLMHPFLPLPLDVPLQFRWLARATHFLFYVLIIVLPLTGWLMASLGTHPISYFGLFNWPHLPGFAGLDHTAAHAYDEAFGSAHSFLAWTMIVLIVLHVAGALYHQFGSRERVLQRMMPL